MKQDVTSSQKARTLATRERLIDSAIRLIATRGYSSTSIAEMTATAQATKNQLFHYFSNKEGLGIAVLTKSQQAWRSEVFSLAAMHVDPSARITFLFEQLVTLHESGWPHLRMLAALLAENSRLPVKIATLTQEIAAELIDLLRQIIKDLRRTKPLHKLDKARAQASALAAAILGCGIIPADIGSAANIGSVLTALKNLVVTIPVQPAAE